MSHASQHPFHITTECELASRNLLKTRALYWRSDLRWWSFCDHLLEKSKLKLKFLCVVSRTDVLKKTCRIAV